jgi:hypothetical protein
MEKDVIGVKECVRGKMEHHVSVDSSTNHMVKRCSHSYYLAEVNNSVFYIFNELSIKTRPNFFQSIRKKIHHGAVAKLDHYMQKSLGPL